MRLALLFFIGAFFLVGATIYGITNQAEGAAKPALAIALIAGFVGLVLEAKQNAQYDNPDAREYAVDKMKAYSTVHYIITSFQLGTNRFQVLSDSPEFGKFVASLNFMEEISHLPQGTLPTQYPSQPRQLTVEANIVETDESASKIKLRWMVQSTVNRDTCDEIIKNLSLAIDAALRAE